MCYNTTVLHHIVTVIGYTPVMADDTSIPKPGTAEIGFLEFGPASARRAALNASQDRAPLAKAGPPEYVPTPLDRIAAALERIALTMERTDI